jgi:DNA-binding CsgD family transcriptional regulator
VQVGTLSRRDLEAVLDVVAEETLEFEQPVPWEVLSRLEALVPCDAISYQELDAEAERFLGLVTLPEDGEPEPGSGAAADEEELYWRLGPCPITVHRLRTADLDPVRMSDLVSRRRYRELPLYREFFHPAGIEHLVDLGLPAAPGRHRSFVLFRGGAHDFSERDRLVLGFVRPHLHRMEAQAELRGRLAEALGASARPLEHDEVDQLTAREREIVGLVAEGKTNAEIAAVLWIAPSTVKKHLEHVYGKLGVGRRAAVAARHVVRG